MARNVVPGNHRLGDRSHEAIPFIVQHHSAIPPKRRHDFLYCSRRVGAFVRAIPCRVQSAPTLHVQRVLTNESRSTCLGERFRRMSQDFPTSSVAANAASDRSCLRNQWATGWLILRNFSLFQTPSPARRQYRMSAKLGTRSIPAAGALRHFFFENAFVSRSRISLIPNRPACWPRPAGMNWSDSR